MIFYAQDLKQAQDITYNDIKTEHWGAKPAHISILSQMKGSFSSKRVLRKSVS